jgi:transposase
MLDLLDTVTEANFGNIVTGDESWFFYENPIETAWAESVQDLPLNPNRDFGSKKTMISIIWSTKGIHSLLALQHGTTYNTSYFCGTVMPDLVKNLCTQRRRKTLKGIFIHLDNARPHNSNDSNRVLEATKARRVRHPPYSPDIAPSDFFLFGALKGKLSGLAFTSDDELLSAITEKFAEFSEEDLTRVYDHWRERLQWVIKHEGEYYQP